MLKFSINYSALGHLLAAFTGVLLLTGNAIGQEGNFGQAYYEPQRGSEERKAIMSAVRPKAEDHFGAPVQFVVGELRVANNLAYVELSAQRPGGKFIDLKSTPAGKRGEIWYELGNNHVVSGFLKRDGANWVAYDIVIGATEAWWVGDCIGLEELMPETCGNSNPDTPNRLRRDDPISCSGIYDNLERLTCYDRVFPRRK